MKRKKMVWKPGNMIYPVPAVMVTVADKTGKSNIITVAWTGTVCTNPPMAYISVRPERYSYAMLKETGEFVINLTTEELVWATDYCGVRSGRDVDKWKETGLTVQEASEVSVPLIAESPVSIECRVKEIKELGSHHLFLAEVAAVDVDEAWLNENGRLELGRAKPIVYSHGEYYGLSALLGSFGYSVRKKEGGKGVSGKQPDKAERKQTKKITAKKGKRFTDAGRKETFGKKRVPETKRSEAVRGSGKKSVSAGKKTKPDRERA